MDLKTSEFISLQKNDEYSQKASLLLTDGEEIIESYKCMRDGVVFTNKRIIAVDVQGIRGKKKEYMSLPYKNIVAFSVETMGTFDINAELDVWLPSLGKVKFGFSGDTDVAKLSKLIAGHVL